MGVKTCPACKGEVPGDAIKCKNCGTDLRSWFRKHPILTILLVLFLIGYIAKTLSKNKESSITAPSSTSSKSSELREYRIDEQISVGYMGYQVFGVKWQNSIGDALKQYPDAKFLVIDIGIVNVDKQPRTFPSFKLLDDQGREYEESSERIFLEGAIGLLKTLNPNVATRGYLVFDVPKGDYKLELSGGYWSSDKAIVRLY